MLDKHIELRKQQIQFYEKTFIKPVRDLIEAAKKVKTNEIPIEHYIKRSVNHKAYIEGIFNSFMPDINIKVAGGFS